MCIHFICRGSYQVSLAKWVNRIHSASLHSQINLFFFFYGFGGFLFTEPDFDAFSRPLPFNCTCIAIACALLLWITAWQFPWPWTLLWTQCTHRTHLLFSHRNLRCHIQRCWKTNIAVQRTTSYDSITMWIVDAYLRFRVHRSIWTANERTEQQKTKLKKINLEKLAMNRTRTWQRAMLRQMNVWRSIEFTFYDIRINLISFLPSHMSEWVAHFYNGFQRQNNTKRQRKKFAKEMIIIIEDVKIAVQHRHCCVSSLLDARYQRANEILPVSGAEVI